MLGTTYNRQGDEISGAAAPESTVTRTILRERAGRGRWGRRGRRGADLVDDVAPFLPDESDDSAASDEPGATAAPSDQVRAAATAPDTTTPDTTAPDGTTVDRTTPDRTTPGATSPGATTPGATTPDTQDQPGPARGAPPAAKAQPSPPAEEVPFVTLNQTASPGSPTGAPGTHPHGDDGPVAAGAGETWQSLPRVPSQGWSRSTESTGATVAAGGATAAVPSAAAPVAAAPVMASTPTAAPGITSPVMTAPAPPAPLTPVPADAPAAPVPEPAAPLVPAARPVASLPGSLSQRFPPVPRPAQPPVAVPSDATPHATPDPTPALTPPVTMSAAEPAPAMAVATPEPAVASRPQRVAVESGPEASDPAPHGEFAAFRDEVALASETLRVLIDEHRSEMSELSADMIELRSTVAAMRTEISLPTQREVGSAHEVGPAAAAPATAVLQPALRGPAEPESVRTPPPESEQETGPAESTGAAARSAVVTPTPDTTSDEPSEAMPAAPATPIHDVAADDSHEPSTPSAPVGTDTAERSEPTTASAPIEAPVSWAAAKPVTSTTLVTTALPAAVTPPTEPTPPAAATPPAELAEPDRIAEAPAAPEQHAADYHEPAAAQLATEEVTRRLAKLDVHAAAAVTSAAARIGLPPAHADVLKQWVAHGGRGIIEVAHAGGRHRVGLAAIVYAVSTGRQVLVVVPNREGADSWRASLATHAPEVAVRIDEGRRRDVDGPTPNVVLSTASTTARRITAGFEAAALLVAIDADRFDTALLAKALDERCEWRLDLSESFRSGGRRLARYADAYFGGTVLTIS